MTPLWAALMLLSPSLAGALSSLTPDGAVVLASAGLALIFWELNRPGTLDPGALCLLCVLRAASALTHHPLRPGASVLLGLSGATLCGNLRYKLPVWLLVAVAATLAGSLRFLVQPSAPLGVHTPVALACGLLVGAVGSVLSRIALRARRAKQVN